MELICDYNKFVGYKVTNESLSHKAWAPLNWLFLPRPLGDWASYAKNRPLFSGNLEATDQCLYLPLWGLPESQGGRQKHRIFLSHEILHRCKFWDWKKFWKNCFHYGTGQVYSRVMDEQILVQELLGDFEVLPQRPCGFVHEPCEFSKLILTFTETLFSFYAEPSNWAGSRSGPFCDYFQPSSKHQTSLCTDGDSMVMLEHWRTAKGFISVICMVSSHCRKARMRFVRDYCDLTNEAQTSISCKSGRGTWAFCFTA